MLTLILFFAAAAGTPPAAAVRPVKAVGACSAVTAAEVERVLGRRFVRGDEETHGADSTCVYASGNGQVSITLQRLRAPVDLAVEIASLKQEVESSSVRLAPEFGGFYLDIADAGTQLHVIREYRQYVMISILGFGDAAQVSGAAQRLAKIALGRI